MRDKWYKMERLYENCPLVIFLEKSITDIKVKKLNHLKFMFKTPFICLILSLTLLSGCATQRVFMGGESNVDPDYNKSQGFWLGGTLQGKDIDGDKLCPMGVNHIETTQSFWDSTLGFLSVGLYTPRSLKVYCNRVEKKSSSTLDPSIVAALTDKIDNLTSVVEKMTTAMNRVEQKVDKNYISVLKQIKKLNGDSCTCSWVPGGTECKDLEVIEGNSCVKDIPGHADLQSVKQITE